MRPAPGCAAQDKGIDQAFWPILELEEVEEGKRGSHWLSRVALAAGLAASVWALHVYAPDRIRLTGAPLRPPPALPASRPIKADSAFPGSGGLVRGPSPGALISRAHC